MINYTVRYFQFWTKIGRIKRINKARQEHLRLEEEAESNLSALSLHAK
jgi:hypothetical protein